MLFLRRERRRCSVSSVNPRTFDARSVNASGAPRARSAVPAVAAGGSREGVPGKVSGKVSGTRGEPPGVTHALSARRVRRRCSRAMDCKNGVLAHGNKSLAGCYGSCSA